MWRYITIVSISVETAQDACDLAQGLEIAFYDFLQEVKEFGVASRSQTLDNNFVSRLIRRC